MKATLTRRATVRASSYDPDANTIEVVWTTGAVVRRCDAWSGEEYDEVLSLAPGAVRLDRLNAGAPFVDSHDTDECARVIGSVVPGSAKIEGGRGIATVQLSKAAGVADTVIKIREGVICNVSVGYWTHRIEKTEAANGTVARWNVVDREPLEISAVAVPADAGAQIRSGRNSIKPKALTETEQGARHWAGVAGKPVPKPAPPSAVEVAVKWGKAARAASPRRVLNEAAERRRGAAAARRLIRFGVIFGGSR